MKIIDIEKIMEWSEGNPGAGTCLLGLKNNIHQFTIIDTLEKLNIKGVDIYIFWNDLCDKDYDLMTHLCQHTPPDLLKNACSREDYSGKALIKDYYLEQLHLKYDKEIKVSNNIDSITQTGKGTYHVKFKKSDTKEVKK